MLDYGETPDVMTWVILCLFMTIVCFVVTIFPGYFINKHLVFHGRTSLFEYFLVCLGAAGVVSTGFILFDIANGRPYPFGSLYQFTVSLFYMALPYAFSYWLVFKGNTRSA